MLDRMPVPIGDFISKHVYEGRLKSRHTISDPKCCTFIDVADGIEVAQGHSWKVSLELLAILCETFKVFTIRIFAKSVSLWPSQNYLLPLDDPSESSLRTTPNARSWRTV